MTSSADSGAQASGGRVTEAGSSAGSLQVDAHDRFAKALREIMAALGPDPCDCCCEGARAEICEALRIAREALGENQ